MSRQHGKNTVIKIAASDISTHCTASELKRTADSHDLTTYGKNAHVKEGGLLDGEFTCEGKYDTTAGTGPRAVLEPLIGQTVVVTRQVEGTGTGKPQDVFDAVLTDYTESNPVADFVTWSAEFDVSDDVDSTAQA